MVTLLYSGSEEVLSYRPTPDIEEAEGLLYNEAGALFIKEYGVKITRGMYEDKLTICVETPKDGVDYPKEYMGFRVGVKKLG